MLSRGVLMAPVLCGDPDPPGSAVLNQKRKGALSRGLRSCLAPGGDVEKLTPFPASPQAEERPGHL